MNLVFWISAFVLASLPWCNSRAFGVWGAWGARGALGSRSSSSEVGYKKPVFITLLESLGLYSLPWLAMILLESQQGQRAAQGWQFWVIALCLWVVLAFPAAAWFKLRKP